jgi:PAS domain S-box-containing protein
VSQDPPIDFPELLASLAGDAAMARPGAPILAWDLSGERLLWASPAAEGLRFALVADDEGRTNPAFPARERLRALGQGLAPARGMRLERLPFDRSRLVPPVTCACRRVATPSGEVLLTAIVGPLPKLSKRPPAAAHASLFAAGAPPAAAEVAREPAAEATPDRITRLRERGTIRFTWQADAEGRFTKISDQLVEAVGPSTTSILGNGWTTIPENLVLDPSGAIAGLVARRETWSGRAVLWRIEGTDQGVQVELAGMPVWSADRQLAGFRGFGMVRGDAISEWPQPEPEERASAEQEPPSDEAEAAPAQEPLAEVEPLLFASVPEPEATLEPAEVGAPEAEPEVTPVLEQTRPAEPDVTPAEEAAAPDPGIPPIVEETHAPELEAKPEPEDVRAPEPAFAPEPQEASAANLPAPQIPAPLSLRGEVRAQLGDLPPVPLTSAGAVPVFAPTNLEGEALSANEASEPDLSATVPPATPTAIEPPSRLSVTERSAFREIARALGARFDEEEPAPAGEAARSAEIVPVRPSSPVHPDALTLLDRLPVCVLVHRGETPLFANPLMLDLTGFEDVEALALAGGIPRIFRGRSPASARLEEGAAPLALSTHRNESVPVEVRLTTIEWEDGPASLLLIRPLPETDPGQRLRAVELDLRARETRLRELSSILDTATDGVVVLDDGGRILSLNRSAEALFGYDQNEVSGEPMTVLFAPESHVTAFDYLEGLRSNGVASLLNDGREVLGRVRQGGAIPLFMTMGRVSEAPERKFCAVLRDITAFKKAEGELLAAKRAAEAASAQKSDFLAKISHEVRTPLNAIIGFAEVMLDERFGPIGNERYKDYLKDIRECGGLVISLVNDLLDLAKIEAGRMELSFTGVALNELVSGCVHLMQTQATRERVVVRTSFAQKLPPVVADERSIRQIVLNILSNAIKFTEAGGQVIVSTAMTDRGEVAVRVRDTGIGMTPQDVEAALEPFRQLATARRGGGTGLGLPLTKALVEANRGALQITSGLNEGTLVEVLFPPTRVLAE